MSVKNSPKVIDDCFSQSLSRRHNLNVCLSYRRLEPSKVDGPSDAGGSQDIPMLNMAIDANHQ